MVEKKLTSFMVMNVGDGLRVSYTYTEINKETGDLVSFNKKANFFVTDEDLSSHIKEIQDFIKTNKFPE